ncbi:MAG: hypothetical protein WB987_02375 [Candidatus Acidiferrales bacterium]
MATSPDDKKQRFSNSSSGNIDFTFRLDSDPGSLERTSGETETQRRHWRAGVNSESRFFTDVRTDWRPIIVASAISVLTVALLGVTIHYARLQWIETGKAAKAAKDSAEAARTAAGEAEKANDLARESLESVQRAFVLFDGNKFNKSVLNGTAYLEFTATFENAGTTPAMVLGHMYDISELPTEPTEKQFRYSVQVKPAIVTRYIGEVVPSLVET